MLNTNNSSRKIGKEVCPDSVVRLIIFGCQGRMIASVGLRPQNPMDINKTSLFVNHSRVQIPFGAPIFPLIFPSSNFPKINLKI